MIRAWGGYFGSQSQSMLMLRPFREGFTGSAIAAASAALAAVIPSQSAWPFLSRRSEQLVNALSGSWPHAITNSSTVTFWNKCRSSGKTCG